MNLRKKGYLLAEFEDCKKAIAACKKIVDDFLLENKNGNDSRQLYDLYAVFGDDPYIVCDDMECKFSAWDYAKQACSDICPKPGDDPKWR